MTTAEAIAYIENYTWSAARLGLERTRALLHALGDPQKGLKFIHVAGSNGKGSTCAMLDSILRCAGYRVGLYTSPYVQEFRERIRVDGENISGGDLAEVTGQVRLHADAMDDHPSQFELLTAIAMVYFLEQKCDIVVLEVGMGGELDSTNAIDAPEVAVITNIGLEHTEYLGNTVEEIARTKAGIIKPGCDVVCYDDDPRVAEVVRAVCDEKGVPFHLGDYYHKITPLGHDLAGQEFQWEDQTFFLPLLGRHQLHNAAVVLETARVLMARGWHLDGLDVERGLARVKWPARFEVLSRDPLFILDGGHNYQCAGALAELLSDYLPGQKVTFLMGVLADKSYGEMLRGALQHYAAGFVCVTPDSPRALPAAKLAELAEGLGLPAVSCPTIEDGIRTALTGGGPVVAFGSLYMAGHIRSAFPKYWKGLQRNLCRARLRTEWQPEDAGEMRAMLSENVCKRLMLLPEVRSAGTIFSYMATPDEPDLAAFHAWAAAQGKTLAFPVVEGGGSMEAMVPEGADCWETDRFGIRCPDRRRSTVVAPEQIDLVVLPCVGFDSEGGRLGHGGGYYDRYLARCPHAFKVLTAFEFQRLGTVCREDNDVPVDVTITGSGVSRRLHGPEGPA